MPSGLVSANAAAAVPAAIANGSVVPLRDKASPTEVRVATSTTVSGFSSPETHQTTKAVCIDVKARATIAAHAPQLTARARLV
jgi:hypothetical protein